MINEFSSYEFLRGRSIRFLVKAMLKHFYVTLLDLPEALEFKFTPTGNIKDIETDNQKEEKTERKLLKFIDRLMQKFGEKYAYIGEDIIGEKFYKRFLFEKNGFMEIMTGEPIVISAHFISRERAKRFADALKKIIEKEVKNSEARTVLSQSIEIGEDETSRLTYEKWKKLRDIRSTIK